MDIDIETASQIVMAVIAFGVMYISFLKDTL